VDHGYFAEPWLCRLFAPADRSVRDGWRMTEEEHSEHLAKLTEKMKGAIFDIGNGQTVGDVVFCATIALACFIYDVTDHGSETVNAKRAAKLLVDTIDHMVKEDRN